MLNVLCWLIKARVLTFTLYHSTLYLPVFSVPVKNSQGSVCLCVSAFMCCWIKCSLRQSVAAGVCHLSMGHIRTGLHTETAVPTLPIWSKQCVCHKREDLWRPLSMPLLRTDQLSPCTSRRSVSFSFPFTLTLIDRPKQASKVRLLKLMFSSTSDV